MYIKKESVADILATAKENFNRLNIIVDRKVDKNEKVVDVRRFEDEMEAITNNMNAVVSEFLATLVSDGIISATKYLMENMDAEKMKQFKEMQEWRVFAKSEAKKVFKL